MKPFLNEIEGESLVSRMIRRTSLILAFGSAAVLTLMMLIIFIDVIGRYFLNRPITGSVEIIYILMGLLVFLGIGLTTCENGHIRVDVITNLLPRRFQALLDAIVHLLSVGTAGLISWRLIVVAIDQTAELNETQVLGLPIWIVAVIMAVTSLMLAAGLLLHFSSAVKTLFSVPAPEEDSP